MQQIHITLQKSERPIHIAVCGSRFELSGFDRSGKIALEKEDGKITVSFVDVEESFPVVEPVQEIPTEVQPEVQPEAVGLHVVGEKTEDVLFKQLAALRKQIAVEVKLPAYMVFHDSTLKEMCLRLPADLESLKEIQGVGGSKLEKYGSRFVDVIRDYAGV